MSNEECLEVAKIKLKQENNLSSAQLIDIIVDQNSTNKILEYNKTPDSQKLSPEQALLIEANLIKSVS